MAEILREISPSGFTEEKGGIPPGRRKLVMFKKILTALLSMALVITGVIPAFAEGEQMPVQSPTINDFSLAENGKGIIEVTWDCEGCTDILVESSRYTNMHTVNKVKIPADDGGCLVESDLAWSKTYVRLTPYNGDTKGKRSEIKEGDAWSSYLPVKVNVKKNIVPYWGTVSSLVFDVYDGKGQLVPPADYVVEKNTSKPGAGTAKVRFTNGHRGAPSLTFNIVILPPEPSRVSMNAIRKNEATVSVATLGDYDKCDYCEMNYSTDKGFSNAKTLQSAVIRKYGYCDFKLTGLPKGRKYYARVRNVKKINGTPYTSDWVKCEFTTAGDPPSLSPDDPTTKAVLTALKGNKSFKIKYPAPLTYQDSRKYTNALLDFRPQYDKFNRTTYYEGGVASEVIMTYVPSKAKKANKLEKKMRPIINAAKKKKGTVAKIKFINKKMCSISRYDNAAYRAHKKLGYTSSKHYDAYTAYGCIVKKKAVCSGYAEAFAAFMTELGIPVARIVTPEHAWNMVQVGNKWLHVDVTWNDCTHSNKYLLTKSHKGLNKVTKIRKSNGTVEKVKKSKKSKKKK